MPAATWCCAAAAGASVSATRTGVIGWPRCSRCPTAPWRPPGRTSAGAHIVDPRTGRPATGALSVTIVGPDLGLADAYATAAFAMGARGPAWTTALGEYDAMTIVAGDRVLASPGFLRHCAGRSIAASLAPRAA